jgi:hypothetical protein
MYVINILKHFIDKQKKKIQTFDLNPYLEHFKLFETNFPPYGENALVNLTFNGL